MALSNSTLAAAMAIGDTSFLVTSATGYPAVGASARSQLVQIDGEFMYTIDGVCQPVAGLIKVRSRGAEGTYAVAHNILAPVKTSASGADWNDPAPGADVPLPPYRDAQVTIGENGVIAVPTQNTTLLITKATALGSTTLAAPSVASNGVRLTITSATAAGHVITATGLIADGASGSPEDTITFDAFIGASITLQAENGLYHVVSNVGTTIT